jgi:serine/threonine-protein kinase
VIADDAGPPADDTIPGMTHVPGSRPSDRPGPTMPGYPISDAPRDRGTMQGHTLEEDHHAGPSDAPPAPPSRRAERKARSSRIAAVVAALMLVPLAAMAAAHFFKAPATADADAAEHELDAARDAMDRRAWDAPPGANVKDITDRALARFPNDGRFLSLRQEAAERIVAEALGRKYAGASDDALKLARLANVLAPKLSAASELARELEQGRGPAVVPASGAPPEPSAKADRRPVRPDPKTSASALPSAAPSAKPPAAGSSSPVLPPQPPPLPDDGPPPTSSSRPWL